MVDRVKLKAEIAAQVKFLTGETMSDGILKELHEIVGITFSGWMLEDEDNFRPHLSEVGDVYLRRLVLRFYLNEIRTLVEDERNLWTEPSSELMMYLQLIDCHPVIPEDTRSLGDILGAALKKDE